MDRLRRVLESHPNPASTAGDEALECIYEAAQCSLVCSVCADACLEESGGSLTRCVRLSLDCAGTCWLIARLLAPAGRRDAETLERALAACISACRACAEECDSQADEMPHCRECADACRACVAACERMAARIVR